MNGLLSPSGEFYSCRIGHHREIPIQGSINSWLYVTPDGVWCTSPLTEAQVKWIKETGNDFYLFALIHMGMRDKIDY